MNEFEYVHDHATISRVNEEAEQIVQRRTKTMPYRAKRIAIRSGRICLGLLFCLMGFAAIDAAPNVSDQPFATLTFGLIGRSILWWLGGLALLALAFSTAFGDGPNERAMVDEERKRLLDAAKEAAKLARMNT